MKTRIIQFAQRCRGLSLLAAVSVLAACAGNTVPSGSRHSGPVPEGYYRVQKGDNLYRIGQRFGQSVNTLAAWNGLHDPGQIEVGQLLRVRSGKGTRSTAVTATPRTTARSNTANTSATASPNTSAATGSSRLQWPVSGPILSFYNGTTQKGIDIGGSRGTPVKAAGAGTVMYVGGDVRGYGNLVLIRHTQTMLTAYAHTDSVRVRPGEQVSTGQTIATMGDSGTDRVKLHFEVRVNGQAVNPTAHLPKN